jgi:hypothetical protein
VVLDAVLLHEGDADAVADAGEDAETEDKPATQHGRVKYA